VGGGAGKGWFVFDTTLVEAALLLLLWESFSCGCALFIVEFI
jgi:hypothetical protein